MSSYIQNHDEAFNNNPKLKGHYDTLAPEYDIIQALIDARRALNITQKELSARTGITQADISRIENGTRNPSLNMIKRSSSRDLQSFPAVWQSSRSALLQRQR